MDERLYRAMMPGQVDPTKAVVNGTRQRLPLLSTGLLDTTKPVGLITARNLQWGSWAVTLDPMSSPVATQMAGYGFQQDPNAPNLNGPNNYFAGGYPTTCGHPLVQLSWGVAGILRSVCFDYPIMGGSFVVNANAIELSVMARSDEGVAFDANTCPQVGAWITPSAQPAGPSSVLLYAGTAMGSGAVPPFAKYLVLIPRKAPPPVNGALPAQEIQVTFNGPNIIGPIAMFTQAVFGTGAAGTQWMRVPVPPGAAFYDVSNGPVFSSAIVCAGLWELSFC